MQDLTPVGLSEDRLRLVLVSARGEEFSVAVDTTLRSALRGEHARLGHLEIRMDSALRPRDIQARIRSGQSAETVAAAAQTTPDKIMAFAAPVLAERAHAAAQAQRASVRRRTGEGGAGILEEAVAERLQERGVDPDAVSWDAWRRDDGRWTLVADYLSGESRRHAEFVYDVDGRYVVADDEEGRWLLGERSAHHGPQPRTAPPTGTSAERRPLRAQADEELPLGDDAIALVSDDPAPASVTALPSVSGSMRRWAGEGGPAPSGPDADWMGTQATERRAPEPDLRAGSRVAEPSSDAVSPPMVPDEPSHAPAPDDTATELPGTADGADGAETVTGRSDAEAGPAPAQRRARRSRARASVPSWDEIMFGSGRAE